MPNLGRLWTCDQLGLDSGWTVKIVFEVSFLALSLVVVLASVVESENRLIKLIEDIFLPALSFLLWLSFSVTKWSDRDILLLYSSVVILCSFLINHLNFSCSVFYV